MSTYTRPAKTVSGGGTTSVVDGNKWPASEINADFDGLVTLVNGNLDTENLSASASIANSQLDDIAMTKVLDYADTITEYISTTTPGDTASPSLPTTLAAEMVRLRYRMAANRKYMTNVYYMSSGGTATAAGWIEPPIVGPNLLPNPGFEVHSAGTPNAPDGWTLVNGPLATVAIENPAFATYGLEKRSLNIVTNGANEGISVAVGGLKSGAKYLIGMAYTLTDNGTVAGVLRLSTTSGLAAGDYQNLVIDTATEAAGTVVVVNGIVKAQTPAVSMTVSITATTAGGDFNLPEVWMYELSDGYPIELPAIPMQTATYSTANDTLTNAGAGAWSNRSDLTLSQYIPFRGYRLTYEVTLCFRGEILSGATDENYEFAFRIQQNIDAGGATTVEGPYAWRQHPVSQGEGRGGIVTLKYVIENPTPGSTYEFTTDAYSQGSGDAVADLIFNPEVATGLATQSQARLVVERI
jgi:hypothetical protein